MSLIRIYIQDRKCNSYRRNSTKSIEKTAEEERFEQLSLDAEKLMDELLVAPSPIRSKSSR